jgi:hypothetical protein
MSSQTAGAVPGPSYSWSDHGLSAVVAESCATRFSLARGATGAASCKAPAGALKAPAGGGAGGSRADRGSCAPATGVVAPRHLPEAPRDFPLPPLRQTEELHSKSITSNPPSAGEGSGRELPAAKATQVTPSAREAGGKEESK